MSSKKTTGQKVPKTYRELLIAFRALMKERDIAVRMAQDNWNSIIEWKARESVASKELEQVRARMNHEISKRDEAEAALDLARQGKEGADLREAAAMEENKLLKHSEAGLMQEVEYLRGRVEWAENRNHELEKSLLNLGHRAGLTPSELRTWNKGVHLDNRGHLS